MDPFRVRPEPLQTLLNADLDKRQQLPHSQVPWNVTVQATPTARIPPAEVLSVEPAFAESVELVSGHFVPPQNEPRESYSFRDVGPSSRKTPHAEFSGLVAGLRFTVNGVVVWVTGGNKNIVLPVGRTLVYDRKDNLVAYGTSKAGRKYELLDVAYTQPLNQFALPGIQQRFQFELNRLSQTPGELITITRLKNASWAHANGVWYQADEDGKVQLGPLESGTYAIIVADRDGEAYAYFEDAVPGDTLQGAFNYSYGWGYYGWYSGKGFEVRKAFIEVFDDIVAHELAVIHRVKTTSAQDWVTLADQYLGRKSPSRTVDAITLDESTSFLGRIKTVVYDFIEVLASGKRHLTPLGFETITLEDLPSYYNTRVRVYDAIYALDKGNRPASWVVLDVIRTDELGVQTKTKQTVYDQVLLTEVGSSTYRQFFKSDQILFSELAQRKNLSKKGVDVFVVLDARAQSLMTVFAEDLLSMLDTAKMQYASVRVRDDVFFADYLGDAKNISRRVQDQIDVLDARVGKFPNRTVASDEFLLSDRLVLGVLSDRTLPQLPAVRFPGQMYLPQERTLFPTERPDGVPPAPPIHSDFIAYLTRAADDRITLLDLIPDKHQPPESEGAQLVECAFLERAYRRGDGIQLKDRGILTRNVYAFDTVRTGDSARLPATVGFAPSGLSLSKIGPYQHRPELRITKRGNTAFAAYLRKDGGLYVAESNPDGSWTNVQAQLAANAPAQARSVGIAVGSGGEPVVCAVWNSVAYVFRRWNGSWLQVAAVSNVTDAQVASTFRYAPAQGRTLLATTSPGESRVLRWQSVQGKSGNGSFVFAHDIRLDQVAVAHGQINWIVANTENLLLRTNYVSSFAEFELRDARPVQFRLKRARLEPYTVFVQVQDTLGVQGRVSGGEEQPARLNLQPRDAQHSRFRLLGGRAVKYRVDTVRADTHPAEFALRRVRLQASTLRSSDDARLATRLRVRSGRLQASTLRAQDQDQQHVTFALTGGSYVRT